MDIIRIDILKDWIDIISSLGVIVVGGITTYIAHRQHVNDTFKLKHELYDKRFEVYRAIREYLATIFREGDVEYEQIRQFMIKSAQAEFLFGDEISTKIKELYSKGLRLNLVEERLGSRDLGIGEERNKLADESGDLLLWFDEESKKMPGLFSKYLKID